MKKKTFQIFWDSWANTWLECATVTLDNGEKVLVSSLCYFRQSACDDVFEEYCKQKNHIKAKYFKKQAGNQVNPDELHLNRYKRAAVLTYAVLLVDPIVIDIKDKNAKLIKEMKEEEDERLKEFDLFYLKQRLAFYLSLGSILQDFPEDDILQVIQSGKTVFQFEELGKGELLAGEDDFQMSLYKDLFFSEYYGNYNVLTMANVYGLLTERCSELPILKEEM